jgi:hypothetical protein
VTKKATPGATPPEMASLTAGEGLSSVAGLFFFFFADSGPKSKSRTKCTIELQ